MRKSTATPEYQAVTDELVRLRKSVGLTQRDLALKLGREQSFVWRVEKGERRLDVLEFYWVCENLGVDAPLVFRRLCGIFRRNRVAGCG